MAKKDKKERESAAPTGGGLKEPIWTIDKIRALKDEDVKSLKANAEKRANQSVIEMCDEVLLERNSS